MKLLRRLYRYLRRYKAWAAVAFFSMVLFAATQTTMIALVQPIFDIVLAPPAKQAVEPSHLSREAAVKLRILDTILKRDVPEGRRGALINAYDRTARRFQVWWRVDREQQARRVLIALIIVFIIRAFTSFFSEYAFQKVGLSTVRDLRNELYERLIRQSHRFFSERSTGEMVSRVVSDADAIQAAVSTRMGDLFQESITLILA